MVKFIPIIYFDYDFFYKKTINLTIPDSGILLHHFSNNKLAVVEKDDADFNVFHIYDFSFLN